MTPLKPCPFCGGVAIKEASGFMWDHCHWVLCKKCGASSDGVDAENYKTKKTEAQLAAIAARKWNRRVE